MLAGNTPSLFSKKAGILPKMLNDQYCKLLLHFDYTAAGGTTIIDSAMGAAASHQFTVHGAAVQNAGDSKFGGAAMAFGGVNADYIDTTNVSDIAALGSGDFCIDWWMKKTNSLDAQGGVFGNANNALTDYSYWCDVSARTIRFVMMFTDATNQNVTTPAIVNDAAWHHYAVERVGNTITIYQDGVIKAQQAITKTIKSVSYKFALGVYGEWINAGVNWGGWIEEFRVTIGSGRFFGAFSVPTAPYDVAPTNGLDAYTTLLLHFDGANGAQSGPGYADFSYVAPKGNLTNAGASQLVTALAKFGPTSWQNSNNGYGTLANHADWNFGANDFTIDWWEYRTAAGAVIARDLATTYTPFLVLNAGAGNTFYATSNGTSWDIASGVAMNNNPGSQWFHQAVVRRANRFFLFLNGTIYNTFLSSLPIITNANALCLGAYANANNMGGYTDEMRISKVARWTNNFTPPSAAYAINPP